ncbi:MAG: hypothetical protein M3R63_09565 [Actinomycetota bacterium]|nr:hypothetical protein [Actinomycetota bacterium]
MGRETLNEAHPVELRGSFLAITVDELRTGLRQWRRRPATADGDVFRSSRGPRR